MNFNLDNRYKDSLFHFGNTRIDPSYLSVILSVLVAFLVIGIIIALISYLFMSIGLYSMAKKRDIKHAWLAFIPIGKNYILGTLVNDDVSIGSLHIPYAKIFLPLASFAITLILSLLGGTENAGLFLAAFLSLALSFYYFTALFWIFSLYSKNHRVAFLILSIILPFLGPIFIFALRNNPDFDERHPENSIETPDQSKAIVSLSLGIFSILSSVSFLSGGFIAGIVGIIFGVLSYKEAKSLAKPSGLALAGLICSIIGIAISVILFISCVACIGFIGSNTGFEHMLDSISPYRYN